MEASGRNNSIFVTVFGLAVGSLQPSVRPVRRTYTRWDRAVANDFRPTPKFRTRGAFTRRHNGTVFRQSDKITTTHIILSVIFLYIHSFPQLSGFPISFTTYGRVPWARDQLVTYTDNATQRPKTKTHALSGTQTHVQPTSA